MLQCKYIVKGVDYVIDKIKRIKELIELCKYHSNLYYNLDQPEISDKEYDLLYNELARLEDETGYIISSSPTQKVQGKVIDYLQKVQHTEPMLSAEKSKDINDIIKFMGNQDCVLSWKLDGLTLVLRYNNGKLQQAITRGGGDEGEDVTHSVMKFTNVPLAIDFNGYLEMRGEGLVTFKDFERINNQLLANGKEAYKSPRNLASGSVRQLDANITKDRNLIFIAFGIVECDKELPTKQKQYEFLENLGFEVVFNNVIDKSVINEAVDLFQRYLETLPYLTDGLIIEYNDIAYGKAQGSTGHHTKNMFALKWNDDSSETIFRGVELNTTRTGMVSVTGLFDEVDIDGVSVSRASLHNYDIFESLQLGIGDTIKVYRANAVIPQIEDNLTRSDTYKINMVCPSCGNKIVLKQPKEARFLFCENPDCPSKLVERFVHFCSKSAMNIEGLSEATLEKFINAGFLKAFADIYRLYEYNHEIIRMEGFGVRSYNKLVQSIEDSKSVKLENLLVALGIPQVGTGGAKRLVKRFADIDAIVNASLSELMQVEDFGSVTAMEAYNYFSNNEHKKTLYDLLDYVTIKQEEKQSTGFKDLTGITFVITGSVNTFKNRDEFKALVESLNGKVAGSVSNKTNYLVNNDVASTSSKNQKARQLGVKIISEADFNLIIGRA